MILWAARHAVLARAPNVNRFHTWQTIYFHLKKVRVVRVMYFGYNIPNINNNIFGKPAEYFILDLVTSDLLSRYFNYLQIYHT